MAIFFVASRPSPSARVRVRLERSLLRERVPGGALLGAVDIRGVRAVLLLRLPGSVGRLRASRVRARRPRRPLRARGPEGDPALGLRGPSRDVAPRADASDGASVVVAVVVVALPLAVLLLFRDDELTAFAARVPALDLLVSAATVALLQHVPPNRGLVQEIQGRAPPAARSACASAALRGPPPPASRLDVGAIDRAPKPPRVPTKRLIPPPPFSSSSEKTSASFHALRRPVFADLPAIDFPPPPISLPAIDALRRFSFLNSSFFMCDSSAMCACGVTASTAPYPQRFTSRSTTTFTLPRKRLYPSSSSLHARSAGTMSASWFASSTWGRRTAATLMNPSAAFTTSRCPPCMSANTAGKQPRERHHRRALHRRRRADDAGEDGHEELPHARAHLLARLRVLHVVVLAVVAVTRVVLVLVLVLLLVVVVVVPRGEPRAEHSPAAARAAGDPPAAVRPARAPLHPSRDVHEELKRLLPRPRVRLLRRDDQLGEEHRERPGPGRGGPRRRGVVARGVDGGGVLLRLRLALHERRQQRGDAAQAVPPRRRRARPGALHERLLRGVGVVREPFRVRRRFHQRGEEFVRALLHRRVLLPGGRSRGFEDQVPRGGV
eukprot:31240-Pelagococcus_subviridis.AAC.5